MRILPLTHRQQGFTLLELLLYVAIVGSLLTAVSIFFATSADARIKNQSITEVNEQGQAAMDIITQSLRSATSVTAPAAGTSASGATVVVPTASLSPTILSLSGTTLQIKEGTAAPVSLTSNMVQVNTLTVKNLARAGTPGSLQVSFTIQRTNNPGRSEYNYQRTFTTTVSLRP